MKYVAPDYYWEFECIADRCRHTCCAGWEIDVDAETLEVYRTIHGEMGEKLQENLVAEDGTTHFRMTEEGRCPFLQKDGLCELILKLGEVSLCQICADHPRFRNYLTDRDEIGLGLCCEAAGRLILTREAPVTLEVIEDDGGDETLNEREELLLGLRDRLFGILRDRSMPVAQRLARMLDETALRPAGGSNRDWAEFLMTLERLDEDWGDWLDVLRDAPDGIAPKAAFAETAFEQLAVYLLYRHLPSAAEDGRIEVRIRFVELTVRLLSALLAAKETGDPDSDLDTLIEIARRFSGEIEYSDENVDRILDRIEEREE